MVALASVSWALVCSRRASRSLTRPSQSGPGAAEDDEGAGWVGAADVEGGGWVGGGAREKSPKTQSQKRSKCRLKKNSQTADTRIV